MMSHNVFNSIRFGTISEDKLISAWFLTFLTPRLIRSVGAVVFPVAPQPVGDTAPVSAGELSRFAFYC